MATSIDTITGLSTFAPALRALGYTTLEQVMGAAEAVPDDLARYLHVDRPTLATTLGRIPLPAMAGPTRRARAKPPLGARLDRIRQPGFSLMRAPGSVAQLPPKIDLIPEMAAVRDQGTRGTCVAHASTAAAEHYWRTQGRPVDLSRQFLYWDCKQHDGDPNDEGTWIGVAMARLVEDGCCTESTWPYVATSIPGNESQAPPPAAALTEAAGYKLPTFRQISANSVPDIKAELASKRCVAFTVPVYNSWYQNDEVTRTGDIVNPIPGEMDVGGHAMCLVGYEDMPGDLLYGGGKFYLRNSWDGQWATASTLGTTGYGTIPYSYIAATCREAFSVG